MNYNLNLSLNLVEDNSSHLNVSERSKSISDFSKITIKREGVFKKTNILSIYENDEPCTESLPFHIRPKRKIEIKNDVDEKDIKDRISKVNERIDRITKQKASASFNNMNFKEQSIQNYQTRFIKKPNFSSFSDQTNVVYKSKGNTKYLTKELLNIDKSYMSASKHLKTVVDSFDELKLNSRIFKNKRNDLVDKYGGQEF